MYKIKYMKYRARTKRHVKYICIIALRDAGVIGMKQKGKHRSLGLLQNKIALISKPYCFEAVLLIYPASL